MMRRQHWLSTIQNTHANFSVNLPRSFSALSIAESPTENSFSIWEMRLCNPMILAEQSVRILKLCDSCREMHELKRILLMQDLSSQRMRRPLQKTNLWIESRHFGKWSDFQHASGQLSFHGHWLGPSSLLAFSADGQLECRGAPY